MTAKIEASNIVVSLRAHSAEASAREARLRASVTTLKAKLAMAGMRDQRSFSVLLGMRRLVTAAGVRSNKHQREVAGGRRLLVESRAREAATARKLAMAKAALAASQQVGGVQGDLSAVVLFTSCGPLTGDNCRGEEAPVGAGRQKQGGGHATLRGAEESGGGGEGGNGEKALYRCGGRADHALCRAHRPPSLLRYQRTFARPRLRRPRRRASWSGSARP